MKTLAKNWCWCLLGLAIICYGQKNTPNVVSIAPPPSARFPASWYPPDNNANGTTAPETGAPYTAYLVSTVHVLDPKGGKVKDISETTFQARDGEGRTRTGQGVSGEVSVNDPVAHCSFHWIEPWTAQGKPTATVSCMPRTVYFGQHMWADAIVTAPKEEHFLDTTFYSEPLGKKMFGDLEAGGTRRTTVVTDTKSGKQQKLAVEIWYSPELKELLEMKQIPDENGATQIPDFVLTQIHRGEPDPSLFYPPKGYAIQSAPH